MIEISRQILLIVAFVAMFAVAPVAPEAGNVLFLVVGAASILFMLPDARRQFARPVIWMTFSGLLLVAIAYVAGARTLEGLVGILYFAPIFAVWPLLSVARAQTEGELAGLVAVLALTGVAGAAAIAVGEVATTATSRAGGSIANPIHFADVALLAGATAMIGFFFVRSRWRLAFLLGPASALVAVVLSGTRGAMVAVIVIMVCAWCTMLAQRLISLKRSLAPLATLAVVSGVALWLGAGQLSGVQRVLADVGDTFRSGVPTDSSTAIRLQMYLGGLRAFLASPIFGQGPLAFVAVANGLADVPFGDAPHLHNDLADFAASAGLFGLIAYGLFMLAPIVEVLRAPKGHYRSRVLVLAVALMAGFFTMGLTNAMFGILTVTTYYAALCLVIGVLVDGSPREVNPTSDR